MKITVLVIEDDPSIAELAKDALEEAGFTVCGIAADCAQSLALASVHQPELALVDVRLAAGDLGTQVAAMLKGIVGGIAILYATGSADMITANDVGDGYLTKPYTLDCLCQSVGGIMNYVRTGARGDLPRNLVLMH